MPELPDLEVLKENIWHSFGRHIVSDVYARQDKDSPAAKLKNQKLFKKVKLVNLRFSTLSGDLEAFSTNVKKLKIL